MKLLTITAMAALVASQTFAGSYEERCETKSVPYQETVKGGSPERIVGGAVVGGVVGKVVTDKNAGAAAGAVVGGVIANETGKKTVTKYRDVETCTQVFIPERITDQAKLRQVLLDLNNGNAVSKEMTMDAQYTIGVAHDGSWGPQSRRAAEAYLANPAANAPMYTLVVNDVVIVSSADAAEVEKMQAALLEAGVESEIFTDTQ